MPCLKLHTEPLPTLRVLHGGLYGGMQGGGGNPNDSQAYNRYGYVLNNPLKYTDPSGEMASSAPYVEPYIPTYSNPYGTPNINNINNINNTGYGTGYNTNTDDTGPTQDQKIRQYINDTWDSGRRDVQNFINSIYDFRATLDTHPTGLESVSGSTYSPTSGVYGNGTVGNVYSGEECPSCPKGKNTQNNGSDRSNWLSNLRTAAGLTVDWALGVGSDNYTFVNSPVANAMRNSPGIVQARNDYYKTGKTEDYYNFGLKGLMNAGIDPIEQFVGSYKYNISVVGNNLQFTLTNITSFSSFLYHLWPSSWNWNSGPMGNTTQRYIFTEPLLKIKK